MSQLKAIVNMVREHETEWIAALCKDVGKPAVEADIAEISSIYGAASTVMDGLKSWINPEPHSAFGLLFPASCEVRPLVIESMFLITLLCNVSLDTKLNYMLSQVRNEPYGLMLIIGPFNFPLALILKPLIGVIAGGNCAVLKPSESCPGTSPPIPRNSFSVCPARFFHPC
jgi:aldehyde dehydrogenase (NAD+)